jgi:Tol biopolymer transport system component
MLLKKESLVLRWWMGCFVGLLAFAVGSAEARASSRICFTSEPTPGNLEIFVMDADGSNLENLTAKPSSAEAYCSWSPDGSQVAFVSDQDEVGGAEIYRVDADGSNETRLTDSPENDLSPAWSPDGTQIAFSSYRDGNMEIYLMDASDGSNLIRLTFNSSPLYKSIDYGPSWSPDGTQIAFQSYRDISPSNDNVEIYKMDADGSNQTRLTNNDKGDVGPTWSPDGTQIAFLRFSTYIAGDGDIFVMDTDGLNQTNLTNQGAVDGRAAWSPDASQIAFGSNQSGSREIYVMEADGSNPTPITANSYRDDNPDWSSVPEPSAATLGIASLAILLFLRGIRSRAGTRFA